MWFVTTTHSCNCIFVKPPACLFYQQREISGRGELVFVQEGDDRLRFVRGLAYPAADYRGHSYQLVVAGVVENLLVRAEIDALVRRADRDKIQLQTAHRGNVQTVILEDRFVLELERHRKLKQQIKREIPQEMLAALLQLAQVLLAAIVQVDVQRARFVAQKRGRTVQDDLFDDLRKESEL